MTTAYPLQSPRSFPPSDGSSGQLPGHASCPLFRFESSPLAKRRRCPLQNSDFHPLLTTWSRRSSPGGCLSHVRACRPPPPPIDCLEQSGGDRDPRIRANHAPLGDPCPFRH